MLVRRIYHSYALPRPDAPNTYEKLTPENVSLSTGDSVTRGGTTSDISANYHLGRLSVFASERRERSERVRGGLGFSSGFGRLSRALVVSHPKRPGDPRPYVVGQNLGARARDSADHPGHLVRGAVMQQPVRQGRIHPARQQGRHSGVRIITLDLRN